MITPFFRIIRLILPIPPFLWENSEPSFFGKILKTETTHFINEGSNYEHIATFCNVTINPLMHNVPKWSYTL